MNDARRFAEVSTRVGQPFMPCLLTPKQVAVFPDAPMGTDELARRHWGEHKGDGPYIVACHHGTWHRKQGRRAALVRCCHGDNPGWHVYMQLYRPRRRLRFKDRVLSKPYRRMGDFTFVEVAAR